VCRNIKTLRRADSLPTEDEVQLAALQYVRKISGYRVPSRRNQQAFEAAVREVAKATGRLLQGLATTAKATER